MIEITPGRSKAPYVVTLVISCMPEPEGDGGGGLCEELGQIVDGFEPFVPPADVSLPSCTDGWAEDAPLREADWVAFEPDHYSEVRLVSAQALAGGSAVLIDETELRWFDGGAGPTASVEHGFEEPSEDAIVVRDADQHLFMAGRVGDEAVIREFADGELLAEISVITPGELGTVGGLISFSQDEWILVGNEQDLDTLVTYFLRVDGSGNQLLRGTQPVAPIDTSALDGANNLLFGARIVDPTNGAVISPDVVLPADTRATVGSALGEGFVSVGYVNNLDGLVGMIDGFGVPLWSHEYERALETWDYFEDVAANPNGSFVLAGADGTWWPTFLGPAQPVLIAFDSDGVPAWKGRLDIAGTALSVDVASDGTIAVAGDTRTGEAESSVDEWLWIAIWST